MLCNKITHNLAVHQRLKTALGLVFLSFSTFLIVSRLFSVGPVVHRVVDVDKIAASANLDYIVSTVFQPKPPLYGVASDSGYFPGQSTLQLYEDGKELGPAHSLHEDIRNAGGGRFSHWGNGLGDGCIIFSTSDNTDPRNNGRTYSVQFIAVPGLPLFWLAVVVWFLCLWRTAGPWLTAERIGSFATVAGVTLRLASWVFVGASAIYGATIIYGLLSDRALPTATIFFLSSTASHLHHAGLFLPWTLLAIAVTGATISWVTARLSSHYWQASEQSLILFWNYAAMPVIFLIFLFDMSGGGWSGQYLQTDINYMSNAGLTPYSDAGGYFSSSFGIGYWGHWASVTSRRPLAAALRNLTVFLGGETYLGTLIAQTVLVTLGIAFALRRVVAWRGVWTGLAFFALVYGLVRPFLLTALTENLGFLLAVVSIGFFAESFHRQSLPMGLLGFATLTGALVTRPGSMFNIPALMLWLPLAFAQQWRRRFVILVGTTGIALVVVTVNSFLSWLYAAPESEINGGFSYMVCGLAHGSNSAVCKSLLAAQIASVSSYHAQIQMVYAEAMRAFREYPIIAFHALWNNTYAFVYDLPAMLMEQYQRIGHVDRKCLIVGMLMLIPGWIYLLTQPGRSLLLSFTLAIIISSIASSAVIFADDGTRTMIVAYVFMAFCVSLGFSGPGTFIPTKIVPLSSRRSTFALSGVLLVLLVIPAVQGATVRWMSRFPAPDSSDGANISIIPGKPIPTGFLVTPDGWRRQSDIPSLDFSQYTAMYHAIYTREFGSAALGYLPQAPFAVIFALPQNLEERDAYLQKSSYFFIGPAELMTDRTPRYWQLELDRDKGPPGGRPFLLVTKATPID